MQRRLRRFVLLSAGLALLLGRFPVSAHHATATQYDISQMVEFKGKISRLDWANPHIHVHIDAAGKNSDVDWDAEFLSPGSVIVSGLSRELLKPGVTITVKGYPSKTALTDPTGNTSRDSGARPITHRAVCATDVILSDGTHVTFGVGI